MIRNLLKYWVTPVKDMQEKCGCDESMGLGYGGLSEKLNEKTEMCLFLHLFLCVSAPM